ncbi:hypothetical protein EYM_03175 [Ignicoccus islandicus DSM 13165]|uniref:Uncharacterized protein n=1 Tax=Ignicoccus islandicus DSM 13165 TaxID=940295 RepID=A0A0U3F8R8_9CREN|nr:hypothetical protein [Ignicoccus islandicus]ALU12392.1 hypothetical protein EYM_03175 [Ignicoccus islandicus DSM 13165]
MIPFGDYLKASEEQIKLLEELQDIIEMLKELPSDDGIDNRIIEILTRLRELRRSLREMNEGEGEDFELLRKYYRLVGIEDEKEILEELLKMSLKGRVNVPQEMILEEINDLKQFRETLFGD